MPRGHSLGNLDFIFKVKGGDTDVNFSHEIGTSLVIGLIASQLVYIYTIGIVPRITKFW